MKFTMLRIVEEPQRVESLRCAAQVRKGVLPAVGNPLRVYGVTRACEHPIKQQPASGAGC